MSLRNRFLVSIVFGLFSYPLLFLIRGYELTSITWYAFLEYGGCVSVIVYLIIESHRIKSKILSSKADWIFSTKKRLLGEIGVTILFTPLYVTLIMSFLYNYLWDLEVQTFLLIEYNLFALNVSFLIGGYLNSDEIIEKWKKSILDKERLEKETIQAKLRALQANLSPHFLFNNFNALNSLIDYNTDQAQEYLEKLSDVYRYILKEKDNELVELSKELTFIRDYLFLLQIRFADQIRYNIDIKNEDDYLIPPVTLQILLENAIKHNEASKENPLEISITQQADSLMISNSLNPKKVTKEGVGFGLMNIRERYSFLTGRMISVNENRSSFSVTIPLIAPEV